MTSKRWSPRRWDTAPGTVSWSEEASEEHLDLFETIINLVHRHAAGTPIAFNNRPDGTFEAASRWLT